jgi:hypothetical protein
VAIILQDEQGEVVVASKQLKHMNELYASIKERLSKPNLDLAMNRDIVESLYLAAIEPDTLEKALAARPEAGSEASLALQARGCILAISEALIEHASCFDAGAPG